MSEITKKDLAEASDKVQQATIAEKQKLNEIRLQNDVSYYRVNTPYEWIIIGVSVVVCLFNIVFGLLLFIILWSLNTKVRVSPIGNSSIYIEVAKKTWSEYRKEHNLPAWKQYMKNHVAEKDVDTINQKKIESLNAIRAQKQSAMSNEKEKKEALYQQAVQPFKDDKAQKFGRYYFDPKLEEIFKDTTLLDKNYQTYSFSDIISYTPIEQGHSKTKKHGITRAVVGGVLAGGAGAVVGAVTGGKNFDYIDELGVSITFKSKETIELLMINSQMEKSMAGGYYDDFHHVCGILDGAISRNNQDFQKSLSHGQIDVADEITKFKHLLDDGTITQEEFDAKKKQLLNL